MLTTTPRRRLLTPIPSPSIQAIRKMYRRRQNRPPTARVFTSVVPAPKPDLKHHRFAIAMSALLRRAEPNESCGLREVAFRLTFDALQLHEACTNPRFDVSEHSERLHDLNSGVTSMYILTHLLFMLVGLRENWRRIKNK